MHPRMKKNVSLTLDVEVIEGVKKLAEESDRSFSQYVNIVLKRLLKSKDEKESDAVKP
ncbi:MAG: toxin-antitoxin system protein [Clostridia bacterium]|nr:toxin-antitoxin system protein [Clostridia bacterium]